jgi:hypothetical protein
VVLPDELFECSRAHALREGLTNQPFLRVLSKQVHVCWIPQCGLSREVRSVVQVAFIPWESSTPGDATPGNPKVHDPKPRRSFAALSAEATVARVARALLLHEVMLVEIIFQYRSLIGKCELGVGLDWDEIEQMTAIESAFAPTSDDRRMKTGRRFRRESTKLSALMRGDRINDRVEISEVGPGGFVCRNAPFVARGEFVEIVIDEGDHSYRFRAQGVWLKDDGDDYRVGLALVGMPVCLHRVAVSVHEADLVDRISAAA